MTDRFFNRQISRRDFLGGGGALAAGALGALACGTGKTETRPTPSDFQTPQGGVLPEAVTPVATKALEKPHVIETDKTLNLGNWEITVSDWEEPNLAPNIERSAYVDPDQYRTVAARILARNIGEKPIDSRILGFGSNYYSFDLVDNQGQIVGFPISYEFFDYGSGILKKPYLVRPDGSLGWLDFKTVFSKKVLIPPGFGMPIGLVADLDKRHQDYGLVVSPKQGGLPNPNKASISGLRGSADFESSIKKGEVNSNFSLISKDVVIHEPGEPVYLQNPNGGKLMVMAVGAKPGEAGAPIVDLAMNNETSISAITTGVLDVFMYLADGRVILLEGGQEGQVRKGTTTVFRKFLTVDPQYVERVDASGSLIVVSAFGQTGVWKTRVYPG